MTWSRKGTFLFKCAHLTLSLPWVPIGTCRFYSVFPLSFSLSHSRSRSRSLYLSIAFPKFKFCFIFSNQEIHFVQWSFGIRSCSSKWSFSRVLAFSHLTNDVFEHILFFGAVPFLDFGTVPSRKGRTDCSSSLCSFWWNRNVLWCFLGTKWSFIAKRETNCSKLRICSGPNWSLMDDFGTIVPKNVFLLITRERFPKYKGRCLLLDE